VLTKHAPTPTVPENQLLFVFGMGRSGTSALTRVLSLCGASLPGPLLGANGDSSTNYWEPLEAFKLNEEFLFRHGATWYDPTLRLQDEINFDPRERQIYIEQIQKLLTAFTGTPLTVIKEPRIVALSDFWFEATRRAGLTAKIIIPVRHPDEVAASLAARDGVSRELSNLLWLKYNLLAEHRSRPFLRVFVKYDNLMSDWRREVGRISETLSVELVASDETSIESFLDPDLHHHRHTAAPTELFGAAWTNQAYAAFCAAAQDGQVDLRAMDKIFAAYAKSQRTFRIALDEFRCRFGPPPPLGVSC
jgi:hypothetical protein